MARNPRLNDLQLILLFAASARADGSFLPLPDSIADACVRVRKAMPALIKHGFAAEQPVTGMAQVWREADGERFGLFITGAGRAFIDGAPAGSSGGTRGDPDRGGTGWAGGHVAGWPTRPVGQADRSDRPQH